MKKPLEVLAVEDNAGDACLLREMFRKEKPGSFHLTHLMRMSDALVHLARGGVDITSRILTGQPRAAFRFV